VDIPADRYKLMVKRNDSIFTVDYADHTPQGLRSMKACKKEQEELNPGDVFFIIEVLTVQRLVL
jgi:hypothetical protein